MDAPRRHNRNGFTLIELMIVILLMTMIVSIAAPRLLPLLSLTEHENEASRLAGYGRAAMAHTALTHSSIRVRIDLDTQEYWAETLPDLVKSYGTTGGYGSENDDDDWIPEDKIGLAQASSQILQGDEVEQEYNTEEEQNKVLDKQRGEMEDRFRSMADNTLFARALRVHHDDYDYVDDESIFARNREYEEEDEEAVREPVSDPLLAAHTVIDSVWIDSITIAGEEYVKGIVDIELTPLGLDTEVRLSLFNEDGDLMTVYWDPMTGNAWYIREFMTL
ncbi:MAG: prepilin-type N-terminal cleavage/methylation domain-containing protein [Candidatus Hydrogenedentota bacterium]